MTETKLIKYSNNFNRDYNWYLKYKDVFNFDGSYDKNLKENLITGKTAKECFYKFDSNGKLIPTKQLNLLKQIFKCKGSINFHIKMWAEGRADGTLPKLDFDSIIKEYELLDWMIEAVEKQKYKYYKNNDNT